MIQIRYAQHSGVAIDGTVQELDQIQRIIFDLIASVAQHMEIKSDTKVDPAPYEHVLLLIMVRKGAGPVNVSVINNEMLQIDGSAENLEALASYFAFPPTAKTDDHNHFEHYEGNDWITPTAEPLVISVK